MTSYSQFGEDKWILANLPLPPKGTFVEVGAYDGIASSNTYGFELEGWNGLCIEPDPEIAARCRRNRRCLTLTLAVAREPGFQWFHVNRADRGKSGLRPQTGEAILVPTAALGDLIAPLGPVHLLSIDTEGTEIEVWDTIGPHRPYIVIMEFWTQPNPPNPDPLVKRMMLDGYAEVHRTTANLIFLKM